MDDPVSVIEINICTFQAVRNNCLYYLTLGVVLAAYSQHTLSTQTVNSTGVILFYRVIRKKKKPFSTLSVKIPP